MIAIAILNHENIRSFERIDSTVLISSGFSLFDFQL